VKQIPLRSEPRNNRNSFSIRSEAKAYLERGWQPIPIPGGTKAPRLKSWQDLRLMERDLDSYFQNGDNIGILLGEVSGDLLDVDLDAPQTLTVADTFLPTTARVHGRKSKPRSHRWYKSPGLHQPKKFVDIDGTCLLEIRSNGQQTVVPPSFHPSGEQLRWESEGVPAVVDRAALTRAVALVAAASLVARHWPNRGSRHEASLSLQGFLLRGGFT
jgi:putative DNA primase/helicase